MRVTVTTSPGARLSGFEKFAPVGPRACHLLPVNLRASRPAQLVKLGVERLAVGADAGIADEAVLGVSFGHILGQTYPLIGRGQANFPEVLNSGEKVPLQKTQHRHMKPMRPR